MLTIEIRRPDFKGSLSGGSKTLLRAAGKGAELKRFTIISLDVAPIDALTLCSVEGIRPDASHEATGGGRRPATEALVKTVLSAFGPLPRAPNLVAEPTLTSLAIDLPPCTPR